MVGTITVLYLGRKGWHAFHKAVGITPGVLTYQDPQAPLLPSHMQWQQLSLNTKHLSALSDPQLRQLQRIDDKIAIYHHYEQHLEEQGRTSVADEPKIVLQKLLYTRLPEVLASYYQLASTFSNRKTGLATRLEAETLLQEVLDNIEGRLEVTLKQIEQQHLQDLQIMKRYLDKRD